jgi:hypothetical protein
MANFLFLWNFNSSRFRQRRSIESLLFCWQRSNILKNTEDNGHHWHYNIILLPRSPKCFFFLLVFRLKFCTHFSFLPRVSVNLISTSSSNHLNIIQFSSFIGVLATAKSLWQANTNKYIQCKYYEATCFIIFSIVLLFIISSIQIFPSLCSQALPITVLSPGVRD